MTQHVDAVVAGGGQAGVAAGYRLRCQGLDITILGADPTPGASASS
ncbi:NAD(P)-binding protein [Streptomyces sp. NPDC003362]